MSRSRSRAAPRPRRASQRRVVTMNLAERSLRHLMIEQSRDDGNYITVYRGSRAALMAAGVPEAAFLADDGTEFQLRTENACCTGSTEQLRGSMRSTVDGYELEVCWGRIKPYQQCAHPAITELARMLLKSVMAWQATMPESRAPDLRYAMDRLATDPVAVDYKPRADAPRLQISIAFDSDLSQLASLVYEFVHERGEVFPCEDTAAKPVQASRLRLVVDNA